MSLAKIIYLVGPHSIGKTTLAHALKNAFTPQPPILEEVARIVHAGDRFSPADLTGSPARCVALQLAILSQQYTSEENLILGGDETFISDRAGIDCMAYVIKYAGRDSLGELQAAREWEVLMERYRDKEKAIVILLEPNAEFWEKDEVRNEWGGLDDWRAFGNIFKDYMNEVGIPFKVIEEGFIDLQERVKRVKGWIEGRE